MANKKKMVIGGECPEGHLLTGDNVDTMKSGYIRCRRCKNEKGNTNHLPSTVETVMDNYKEPLRAVSDGFGYQGTIAFDKATQTHTQCHICGNLYKYLPAHIRSHDITSEEYRDEFGLPAGVSLLAPKHKNPIHVMWHSMTEEEKLKRIEKLNKSRVMALAAKSKGHSKRGKALYFKNLEGRCPDQLLDKIQLLADEIGKPPSGEDFSKKYGSGTYQMVRRTFGKWSEALKILKMQPRQGGVGDVYNRDMLLQILIDFKQMNGREATYVDAESNPSLPMGRTFLKYFGSWGEAKEAAYGGR